MTTEHVQSPLLDRGPGGYSRLASGEAIWRCFLLPGPGSVAAIVMRPGLDVRPLDAAKSASERIWDGGTGLSRGHEVHSAMRLSEAARSRDARLHARTELPALAVGVAAYVSWVWKPHRDGRV
jgi:hypothetical protein